MYSSSVSAIFGVKISPNINLNTPPGVSTLRVAQPVVHYGDGTGIETGMKIECSSRPQKKATAHHRKTRPKKTQPWDKNRRPAVYPPLPPLPAEWSFANDVVEAASSSSSSAPASISE